MIEKVKSVELKPRGVKCGFVIRQLNEAQVAIETDASNTFKVDPHDDLLNSLGELVPHLVALTEQEPVVKSDLKKKSLRDRFVVRGVKWYSKDGHDGVELKGYRLLTTAHHVPLSTRRIMFQQADSDYEFVGQLEAASNNLHAEVIKLIGGKCNRPAQTAITDPDQGGAGDEQ